MLTREQEFARKVACNLRESGLNPLPSRPEEKLPWMDRYAHLWSTQAPDELFTPEGWPPTTNIQLMTGSAWGLIAFDLDGPEAIEEWGRMCQGRFMPDTWVTHSGGGGLHAWFSLPRGWSDPLPKGEIWRPSFPGPRAKGEPAIERLCDRSLVMFPPSIHPRTGRMYIFDNDRCRPPRMSWPAVAPDWVMRLKPLKAPVVAAAAVQPIELPPVAGDGGRIDIEEILSRIRDKVGLAQSWGVRVAGHARSSGWVPCKAIDREDRRPSAAIHAESGVYADSGSGRNLSFVSLMIAMGRAADFRDAKARLAEQFC